LYIYADRWKKLYSFVYKGKPKENWREKLCHLCRQGHIGLTLCVCTEVFVKGAIKREYFRREKTKVVL